VAPFTSLTMAAPNAISALPTTNNMKKLLFISALGLSSCANYDMNPSMAVLTLPKGATTITEGNKTRKLSRTELEMIRVQEYGKTLSPEDRRAYTAMYMNELAARRAAEIQMRAAGIQAFATSMAGLSQSLAITGAGMNISNSINNASIRNSYYNRPFYTPYRASNDYQLQGIDHSLRGINSSLNMMSINSSFRRY
jgi:hypothetical protein